MHKNRLASEIGNVFSNVSRSFGKYYVVFDFFFFQKIRKIKSKSNQTHTHRQKNVPKMVKLITTVYQRTFPNVLMPL